MHYNGLFAEILFKLKKSRFFKIYVILLLYIIYFVYP